MGMFDTFAVPDQEFGQVYAQSKNFDCTLDTFRIGDVVDKNNRSTMVIHDVMKTNRYGEALPDIEEFIGHPVRTVFIVIYRGVYVQGVSVPFALSEGEILDKSVILQKSWEGPDATEHLNRMLMESADRYKKSRDSTEHLLITIDRLVTAYENYESLQESGNLHRLFLAEPYMGRGYTVEDAVKKVIHDHWNESGD